MEQSTGGVLGFDIEKDTGNYQRKQETFRKTMESQMNQDQQNSDAPDYDDSIIIHEDGGVSGHWQVITPKRSGIEPFRKSIDSRMALSDITGGLTA